MGKVGTILLAAGASARIGAPYPKQFIPIGPEFMFRLALGAVHGLSDEIVLVVPKELPARVALMLDPLRAATDGKTEGRDFLGTLLKVVEGGARRQDSVANGLAALSDDVDIVLIHDSARPFPPKDLVSRVIEAAAEHGAAVPVIPINDTVKRVEGGRVAGTEDRSELRLAQTPQGFRRSVIQEAYRALGDADVTDDVSVVERTGQSVATVEGDHVNFKVTTPFDLEVAVMLGQARAGMGPGYRAGTGSDTHRLAEDRRLVLCGVEVPFEKGLDGHSDADVATHAVMDALLGAVAAGDIGYHFPPDDPAFKGASSVELLAKVVTIVGEKGCSIENVDVTVIAEAPKLAPHIARMRDTLAGALGIGREFVSVKATTTEGLGPEGEGLAMSAVAVAVVRDPSRLERVLDSVPRRKRP